MKNIILLGASGSIGRQTMEVIDEHREEFQIVALTVGKQVDQLEDWIKKYQPKYVSVLEESKITALEKKFPSVSFGFGDSGLIRAVKLPIENAVVVNALVGMVGLIPTIKAIECKKDILLANKETLVAAGSIVMKKVKEHGVNLFPIDSEHSALFQCMLAGRKEEIKRIIITASGGAFRDLPKEQLQFVTRIEALSHPNWSMGDKITIDSATMVNKGLEVIEAHYLFDIPVEQIETVIHRESIIHSMVEYIDGSMLAQCSYPTMKIPILYALSYPNRLSLSDYKPMDFKQPMIWHFEQMDTERFPCVLWAMEAIKKGGVYPAIYNAANEAAVSLFLSNRISFVQIEQIIKKAMDEAQEEDAHDLEAVIEIATNVKNNILKRFEVKT